MTSLKPDIVIIESVREKQTIEFELTQRPRINSSWKISFLEGKVPAHVTLVEVFVANILPARTETSRPFSNL